jgi:hypothetical protein
VLQGHPAGPPPTARRRRRGLHVVEVVDQQQVGRLGQAQHVHGQRAGVVLGAVDAGRASGGRRADGVAQRRSEGGHARPRSGELGGGVGVDEDWMTASRSPSSTCARLLAL